MNDRFSDVLVLAPNWLGDVLMALPAIADVRRQCPSAQLTVAARRSVAEVFRLVPAVDRLVTLEWSGHWWRRSALEGDVGRLRDTGAELAILLPNSFASAWLMRKAAIGERWGYASDLRRALLTRAVPRPAGSMHQGAYYQYLTRELGIDSGPLEPVLTVPDAVVDAARRFLVERGWQGARPLVVFAPGAAYGTAKRWLPASVARVAASLVREQGRTCVLVGSRADRETTMEIRAGLAADVAVHVLDVTGETTLDRLAGIMAAASACVSNDSGAMHVAAAVGTPLVAVFGPTNEYETAPLTREGRRAVVLTHPVWCRPCMLRECPIDHRCMKRITPERVLATLDSLVRGVRLQPDLS
ncbi:MAG: lipopolysaccharide heptosyltransferase II [Acidobacteria bacterium]|nr:lipopolysaccharide heptosyltransferase II [Acidobacteriota bacterium]